VSSLALMRWLEATPERYDAGMRWLTLGRAAQVHAELAAGVASGARALELGCGTGALTARLVERGAQVTAFDQNPEMLDRARARLAGAAEGAVAWQERAAAEIDALPEAGFDVVLASFSLSEMSPLERAHVLREARRRLCGGGTLAIGDELRPRGAAARGLFALLRLPQALLGWLLAGSLSRPIVDLAGELGAAGFEVVSERRFLLGSLGVFVARPAA
jgi:ubiquinone/menaquinone biosynthesis C-methylase UbiE